MKNLIGILIFGLVFYLGQPYAGLVQSAEPQEISNSPPGAPLFSTEVNLVNVSVVLLGRKGEPLPRLGKQNFKVSEKKIGEKNFHEVEINLELPEQLPLRGGITIDTSGSTSEQFLYQLDVASELVKWIIREISDKNRGDKFFVSEFYYEPLDQNPAKGVFTLKQDWTDNINALVRAIIRKTKKAAGGSPLFGSIESASRKFMDEPGNFANFLIVVSDGQNNMPFSGLKNSAYLAQAANLSIYTIGTISHDSTKVDPGIREEFERNLKETSRLTGGRFFDLPRQDKLPEIARRILTDLRNQYHLSYKLNPNYKNGDEIQIRIEIGDRDKDGRWRRMPAKLLHRNGYRVILSN
ncbi:MAG: VWA domain-containing protein [Candidatus Yanofskybacteria bacterium]|nr:VWA domain-containing protein [Candidatus Yanofskybacteria bacterium]